MKKIMTKARHALEVPGNTFTRMKSMPMASKKLKRKESDNGSRPASSYQSSDPRKRAAQLANLARGRSKGKLVNTKLPETDPFHCSYRNDIVRYIEDHVYITDTKKRVVLETWQKESILKPMFEVDPSTGLRKYNLALIGVPKKNGKSTLAAMIANYFMFQDEDSGQIILTANSREQSSSIIFNMVKESIKMNPHQVEHVRIREDSITNIRTGTIIRTVSPNYRTVAGHNASLTVVDELWAYELDSAKKFWAELTISPARKQPLSVVVTYAGHDQDSLLYELYKKGLSGQDRKMFFFWSHENLASWVTNDYLESQRSRLRTNDYLRMHENRWTAPEDAFIDLEQWNRCIDDNHKPILPDKRLEIIVGVDASTKEDSTAVVACTRKEGKVILVCHRKWQPSKNAPLDLEETVEPYIVDLASNYDLKEVLYDGYQFHRSAMTLKKRGINMTGFPQTSDRLTEASQNLYDLIKGRNIVLYKDAELTAHAQKAVAQQTQRGWRIDKRAGKDKIDLIIALAMAALGSRKIGDYGQPKIRVLDDREHDRWSWAYFVD